MDNENLTPGTIGENRFTERRKKAERAKYISGFATGFLSCMLVVTLSVCGPAIYKRYVKGEIDYKAKQSAIYNIMKKYYIDDIDMDELYEGIYLGMASVPTDRYSYYMSSEDAKSYNEKTDGNYVGIGVVITQNIEHDGLEVTTVYKPSPAYDAGIKKGDIIKSVSGKDMTAESLDEAVSLVRGTENTTVDLVVYRPSDDKEYDITSYRKNVEINTVFWRMLDNGVGYIRLTDFDGVTPDQYRAALANLEAKGMEKLVIDVRNNPGGLLMSIAQVADTLIPKGVLTYTEDKYGKKDYVYTQDDCLGIPLCVLVNGSSASASELLTGAVKDTGMGTIVGTKTFGKGIVQTPFELSDGSLVKLTTSRYYTPNGTCIDGIGIEPDVVIEAEKDFELPDLNDEDAVVDPETDVQLKKALEVLADEN
ncbi:MAG: S41 family peptidase [Firmicutes bacterium]|nr:S41 family peptidase [Bacillota bacterium]